MLQMVIFDFDGVIADTEPAHFETFRQILHVEGLTLTWQQYCERYLAFDDYGCFTQVLRDNKRAAREEKINELVEQKKANFGQYLGHNLVIYPGVKELLSELRSHDIICSVCSGSFRSEIEYALRTAGLRDFFVAIVAADDVSVGKPEPEGYLLCLSQVNQQRKTASGIQVRECVAIEDSIGGIRAAKAAGLICLAVTNSYPQEHLSQADAIVGDLNSINVKYLRQMVD